MKNSELYYKTVDILVQAYFNDTLEHGSCSKCAVGNLITANMCRDFTPTEKYNLALQISGWSAVFMTNRQGQYIKPEVCLIDHSAKEQIDITGYNLFQLAKIEAAFENVNSSFDYDKYMFNGLMAVIEVLDEIHDNKDADVTTVSKQRFVKQPA